MHEPTMKQRMFCFYVIFFYWNDFNVNVDWVFISKVILFFRRKFTKPCWVLWTNEKPVLAGLGWTRPLQSDVPEWWWKGLFPRKLWSRREKVTWSQRLESCLLIFQLKGTHCKYLHFIGPFYMFVCNIFVFWSKESYITFAIHHAFLIHIDMYLLRTI